MRKQEISDAIAKVKPALMDGKIIEFRGLLLFDGEKLVCYGDELSVSVPLKTDFQAAVPSEEFGRLIQKVQGEEVILTLEEKQLLVRAGKMKAGFSTAEYNPESIPDLGLAQVRRWFKFPEDFADALKFCIFSASDNDAYGVLCNLKVEQERIISSDNYRITERTISERLHGVKSFILIPRKVASFLYGIRPKEYVVMDSCIHYRDDAGAVFTHRVVMDEYPTIDEYLLIEGETLELPKAITGTVERANSIFSVRDDAKVTISILPERQTIEIRSESSGAWFEEPIGTDYQGKDLKFDASPEHLLQILRHSSKVTVGQNAILFVGENFRHSVCLIG